MKSDSGEMVAIGLVKEITGCHKLAIAKVAEGLQYALKCGELLIICKENLQHGEFGGFIEQYMPFSHETANGYMKLHKDLESLPNSQRAKILESAESVRGLRKLLPAPSKKNSGAGSKSSSQPGKGGSGAAPAPGKRGAESAPAPPSGGSGRSSEPDAPDEETPTGVDEALEEVVDGPGDQDNSPNQGKLLDRGDTVRCPWCNGTGEIAKPKDGGGFAAFRKIIMESDLPKTARFRKNPKGTERAWKAACKRLAAEGYEDPEGLLRVQVGLYVASHEATKDDAEYCPNATTWLNGDRFLEHPEQWANGRKKGSRMLNQEVYDELMEEYADD